MAKNFVQVGDIIEVVAPSGGCTTGVGYVIGDQIFGVALTSGASGTPVNVGVTGVWTLPKVTTVQYLAGAKLWWDNNAKTVTATATSTATMTTIVLGIATATAVTAATSINVLLARPPAAGA